MSATDDKKTESATNKAGGKVDLGLLEEDDEFEEFPAESWANGGAGAEADEDAKVWDDNWDDDNIEDDFSVQLRTELEKQGLVPKEAAK